MCRVWNWVDFAAVDVDVPDMAVHGQMREEGFHVLCSHLLGRNPLASTVLVEPQNFLDPPTVGLDRAASQTAHLAGGFVPIKEPHALESVAQESRGQFARSYFTYPDGPVEIDMPVSSGILKASRSQKQSSAPRVGAMIRIDARFCLMTTEHAALL